MASKDIDVRYTAELARIHLTEDEVRCFQAQLSQVLEYMEKLEQVDVAGVEPTAHATPLYNVLRDDVARETFSADEALANAPARANDLFVVTKVIE
jgi:aspartyl-tRNA(Asn)/glutamyl-tRNA(Gln) amidotransferase subunit C